jgi:hypothetical protein
MFGTTPHDRGASVQNFKYLSRTSRDVSIEKTSKRPFQIQKATSVAGTSG